MPTLRAAMAAILLHVLSSPAAAQVRPVADVIGHELGGRITQHHEMAAYLDHLAAASPLVTVERLGESWEGRDLLLAVVTAPENYARLEEILRNAHRLADPRSTAAADAEALVANQPAIVWLGGSIHGFELSGSEGLLKLLDHLVQRDDDATRRALRDLVILIDPMLNPDGRDAFAHLNHEHLGRVPNPERGDWGNDFTSWQAVKFRTGHYYFDTNRDWFAHTQRETRARAAALQRWRPQVVVDLHEMGADAEFYFDPPGDPVSPFLPPFASRWFRTFGAAYAAAFDSAGFEYMSRERYNYFYPGYTTSYGSQQGAVGMLYEQGSSRGLALTRADGSVRRLADALEQQYLAAWTAIGVTVRERERLLREYHQAHREAVDDGGRGIRRYLLPPEGDPVLIRELAALLGRNGIEVQVLGETARLSGVRDRAGQSVGERSFPAGTYVVEAAQPRNRLLRTLLERDTPLPAPFLQAARARVERDENPRFYDITAWSLPLLFNVSTYGSTDGRALPVRPSDDAMTQPAAARAAYAYLLDGRSAASLAALYHLKAEGYRAAVLTAPTRIAGRDVAGGAVVLRVGQNDSTLHAAVARVAARFGIAALAVPTGLSDSGYPALGSGDFIVNVERPEIAILAEDPIAGYSFGWAWYTLDRQHEIPTTVLRTGSVGGTDLSRFNVIVIPDAPDSALSAAVGERGRERLMQWVRDGGTLVVIGRSTDFARERLALIDLRSWYDLEEHEDAQAFDVPGAILRVELDRQAWLSAGYDAGELPVLVDSERLYLAPDGPPSSGRRTVGRYASGEPLSGHVWPESGERLPGAVFLYEQRVGDGRVIAFAEDPNYRGYWRGANRLFLNAVVLGPGAP